MWRQQLLRNIAHLCLLLALTFAIGGAIWAQDEVESSDSFVSNSTDDDSIESLQTDLSSDAMFDTDRNVVLTDSDSDGFPDLTEALEMTNPLDNHDYPGAGELTEKESSAADQSRLLTRTCRPGYRLIGTRLCISINVHDANSFANAMVYCRDRRSRVADYADLRYVYIRSSWDSAYNPNGRWIGNFVADDKALCGNRSITFNNDPDIHNFEGECTRFDIRNYWCAYDRD